MKWFEASKKKPRNNQEIIYLSKYSDIARSGYYSAGFYYDYCDFNWPEENVLCWLRLPKKPKYEASRE
jgi:hypothetical protein